MWTEFLTEYGMFLAKLGTVVFIVLILTAAVIFFYLRAKSGMEGHLEVKNINQKYHNMELILKSAIQSKKQFKKTLKDIKARFKDMEKRADGDEKKPRIFVLEFNGDIRASEVASLREEITAILTVAETDDEVLVKLESGGGTVHGYGLAASQLKRIRDQGLNLTVSVDKVAASGGYMMACVANKIIAAPFAVIGSIGVLAQLPNFHRFLKKHDIDFEQIAAGKYKRTLSLFGENTEEDRQKFKEELEEAHELFKQFVKENRVVTDIEKIATGEYWYGKKALELNLVDELRTSDDFLCVAADRANIFQLEYVRKKPFLERMFSSTIKQFKENEF